MIPICYCGNDRMFEGVVLSALSVANNTAEPLNIYLLTADLTELNEKFKPFTEAHRRTLEEILQRKNPLNEVKILDAGECYRQYFSGGKNERSDYTPYAQLRLFLDRLGLSVGKLIYLDADVMCLADAAILYNTDMTEYEFAAARDVVGSIFIYPNYCNSGVLLLNLDKIRETGLFEKCIKRVRRRRMFMPDQSSLNFKAKKKLILPRRFNEQRGIREDTVFKHFCQGFKWYGPFFRLYNYKQWHRAAVREKLGIRAFDGIYEEYDELKKEFPLLR